MGSLSFFLSTFTSVVCVPDLIVALRSMLEKEVIEAELTTRMIQIVHSLLTSEDGVKVEIIPPYTPSKYDGLFSLTMEELISQCKNNAFLN